MPQANIDEHLELSALYNIKQTHISIEKSKEAKDEEKSRKENKNQFSFVFYIYSIIIISSFLLSFASLSLLRMTTNIKYTQFVITSVIFFT